MYTQCMYLATSLIDLSLMLFPWHMSEGKATSNDGGVIARLLTGLSCDTGKLDWKCEEGLGLG